MRGPNIPKQDDAGVFVRAIGAERGEPSLAVAGMMPRGREKMMVENNSPSLAVGDIRTRIIPVQLIAREFHPRIADFETSSAVSPRE
jgi:hypothetical protein